MKIFVLILSFLLTIFTADRPDAVSTVSVCQSSEETVNYTQNRDICITAAQGYAFAGSNDTNSLSLRITQPLKRLNQPVRSTFRIVKGGKVVDNNHLHPFLAQSFVHLAGFYIPERFLFSICRLRL